MQILRVMSTVLAVFIWSLGFWFFCIATLACLVVRKQMSFQLNWYAFIFPNVGFTIATISIGKSLRSEGIQWVGSIMTILLIVTYLIVAMAHVRAFVRHEVCWPGKDADFYEQEERWKHTLTEKEKGRLGLREIDLERDGKEK